MLLDVILFLTWLLRGLFDSLIGRSRRRYEHSTFIRAPKPLVWEVASANKIRFEGSVPIEVDCAPVPGDETLIEGTITVGNQSVQLALRELSEVPGEAKVVQILAAGTDPALLYGDDYFVGYTLNEAPGGTIYTATQELTHTSFWGRALVPVGLAQTVRRIKEHCERKAGVEPAARASLWDTAMTGLLTFGSFLVLFGPQSAALLVLIILLHECGHALAMRSVGQPVQGIYFIPFFGGVAVAAAPHANETERGFVSFMGPGASLFTTALFYALWLQSGNDLLADLVLLSAFLNVLNLAPVLPLDGGHVLGALMSRGDRGFSELVRILFLLAGIAVAIHMGWYILTAFLALNLLPLMFSGGHAEHALAPIDPWAQLWLTAAYIGAILFYVLVIAGVVGASV